VEALEELVQMGHQGHLGLTVDLDQPGLRDLWGQLVVQATLDYRARQDLQGLLDLQALLVMLEGQVQPGQLGHKERAVTLDPLDQVEYQDQLDPQDFLEVRVHLVLKDLLGVLVFQVQLDHLVLQEG